MEDIIQAAADPNVIDDDTGGPDAAREFCGYRIEGPGGNPGTEPDCGEELIGRYWWTLVLGGQGDVTVSDGNWATFAEALADAHKHATDEFNRMLDALREIHANADPAPDGQWCAAQVAARGLGL